MALTLGSVVVQDLTYTEKQLGLAVTISYTNGSALAVSVSSHAISVAIISGTSTATQIKAAIEANADASALVTVTISGTGSNTQKTCKNATLSGGTAAAKASLTIGECLKLTADSTGTSGNSVRFKFTTGGTAGAEIVTVSTNDISVQIEEGVSTFAQVKAAIDGDTGAAALVDTSLLSSQAQVARVAMAASFTALSGGTALTAASKVVQDLTFTADTAGTAGNDITVTYTTGATAGAEVVSVVGHAISVQIQNGVSTATQIKTALDASSPASTLIDTTISGTSGNAQKTVNGAAPTGEVGEGVPGLYKDQSITALTSSFVRFDFGGIIHHLDLVNDETSGVKLLVFSFDGINTHGSLSFGQTFSIDNVDLTGIYVKYSSAAPNYRLFAN